MFRFLAAAGVFAFASIGVSRTLEYRAEESSAKGRHIVLVASDHEYRGEEALPALARILTKHHGFDCTVLFGQDEDGVIVPGHSNIPGLEALEKADAVIMFTRFQALPDEQMKHIDAYLNRAGPIMGLRTATHGFRFGEGEGAYSKYHFRSKVKGYEEGFGHQVLGQSWVGHYGPNHQQSTRISIIPEKASHPILRGVSNMHSQAGGYNAEPQDDWNILTMAQPLMGMPIDSEPDPSKPPMASEWTREYAGANGEKGRVFTSLYGTAEDFLNLGYRRMIVNATYWLVGLEDEIEEDSPIAFLGNYRPNRLANQGFSLGVKVSDYEGFESRIPTHNKIGDPIVRKAAYMKKTKNGSGLSPVGTSMVRGSRPNIVYIMLDEWGYFEWSGIGHSILDTPNIDRLAAEGMRFTQMLAGGNVCATTRSVLMTGQHLGHTAIRSNGGRAALADDEVTVARILKDAGYETGGFGKWGLGDVGTTGVPEKHGFDTFFGYYHQTHAHTYYPEYLVRNSKRVSLKGNTGDFYDGETFSHNLIHEEGLKFIREYGSQDSIKKKPFFAYLAWTPPHGQWGMPDDDPAWLKYKDKKWDAKNQRGEHDAQVYAAMVEMADRQIGEIVDLLKELEIDENTIIFLCGDNGGQPYFANESHPHGFLAPNLDPLTGSRFRGGKGNFYEGGLRVPFMVRWPGRIQPRSVSDHIGYFPDVMPTLAELAGTKSRKDGDGISLTPTLFGEETAGRKQKDHAFLYWEDPKSVAVRMGNWKAIRPKANAEFELYDLSVDREELQDVSEQYPKILKQMRAHARSAHVSPKEGVVLDASVGYDVKAHRIRTGKKRSK